MISFQALLAHNNWLASLKGGGNLKDLHDLRVFDLHHNELTSLPDDINLLASLQVLNLEDNKLKTLPPTLAQLKNLQTLNLKGETLQALLTLVLKMLTLVLKVLTLVAY